MLTNSMLLHKVETSPPPSPTGVNNPRLQARHTAGAKRQKYLRRIFKFQQMDFEFALWQMLYLFISPQKVYRNFQYRKQTKDQWARDDPAFLVLLSICLCVSSIGFAIVLKLHVLAFFKFLLWVVFVDCIGVGLLIASLLWFVTNKYLRSSSSAAPQDVEWGYAFDVHLNAFFPLLMILHFLQLFLLKPVIAHDWFISYFLGNTLWLIALSYYIYITFLGYSALPFLKKTVVLLYPSMLAVISIYVLSLIMSWNWSRGLMDFYEFRVL
ncbi:protein unc-50 homolog A-like [Ptychodera flava]|uniref:protein unc-50 homolog A-like n=1 Tax=Ptychodera flava TaxID=63121 RepID=UPI00396A05EB